MRAGYVPEDDLSVQARTGPQGRRQGKGVAGNVGQAAREILDRMKHPPAGERRPVCPACGDAPYPGETCRCEATAWVRARKAEREALRLGGKRR